MTVFITLCYYDDPFQCSFIYDLYGNTFNSWHSVVSNDKDNQWIINWERCGRKQLWSTLKKKFCTQLERPWSQDSWTFKWYINLGHLGYKALSIIVVFWVLHHHKAAKLTNVRRNLLPCPYKFFKAEQASSFKTSNFYHFSTLWYQANSRMRYITLKLASPTTVSVWVTTVLLCHYILDLNFLILAN